MMSTDKNERAPEMDEPFATPAAVGVAEPLEGPTSMEEPPPYEFEGMTAASTEAIESPEPIVGPEVATKS
jgi:hypothetical protein